MPLISNVGRHIYLQHSASMSRRFVALLASALAAASPGHAQETFVAKNLARGLLCHTGEADFRVCKNTEVVQITGDSECTYDIKSERCTWYGFAFEYEPRMADMKLFCSWSSSEGGRPGNPLGASAALLNEGQYELVLKAGTSRFINPQYAVLPKPGEIVPMTMKFDQRCTYRGATAFEFSLILHFPRN
jgi:hypothetical protein